VISEKYILKNHKFLSFLEGEIPVTNCSNELRRER
jgi:hypothetical protein